MDVSGRRWLTIKLASEVYSLHPKTLLALCRQKRVPFSRVPSIHGGRGQIRIDRSALDRQLEAGEVLPAEATPDRRRA
jgi:hypothetical protein